MTHAYNPSVFGGKCEICGEIVRVAILRNSGRIICTDCFGDHSQNKTPKRMTAELADIQYHGGLFHRGEW